VKSSYSLFFFILFLDKPYGDVYMRASQHIQSHGYFAFPVDGDELSFKAGRGAFYAERVW